MYILRTFNLSKKYRDKYAVKNLSMNIEKGSIYGFIGENGAGKSTTLKLITDLVKPDSGEVEIFGQKDTLKRVEYKNKVGGYIDSPNLYLSMTAYQNLEVMRRSLGSENCMSINETLNLVGLKDVQRKRVENFSLGMKQRLAIGMSLIGNPQLVLLDEPVNGLDPSGIQEFRCLINDLREKREITFVIASHILSELERVATHYGIIKNGRLIKELSKEDLNKSQRRYIEIEAIDINSIKGLLSKKFKFLTFDVCDNILKVYDGINNYREVSEILVDKVKSISVKTEGLEDFYMTIERLMEND